MNMSVRKLRWRTKARGARMRWSRPRVLDRGLGWFSVGLGLAEIVAGGRLARTLGIPRWAPLVRVFGARELATGIGILVQPRATRRRRWILGRLAGDVLDLTVLGWALVRPGASRRTAAAVATGSVAAVTALDAACGAKTHSVREWLPLLN